MNVTKNIKATPEAQYHRLFLFDLFSNSEDSLLCLHNLLQIRSPHLAAKALVLVLVTMLGLRACLYSSQYVEKMFKL